MNEHKNVTHKQTTITELQAPDFGQAYTERSGVKLVSGIPTPSLTWDSGVTVQHKNEV